MMHSTQDIIEDKGLVIEICFSMDNGEHRFILPCITSEVSAC